MSAQRQIKGVNFVFLAIVLASIVFQLIVGVLTYFGIDIFMGSYALQIIYSQVLFLAPALVYMIFFHKDIRLLRFKKIRISTIFLCILLYICIIPVLNFLNALSMLYSTNVISDVIFSMGDEIPFVFSWLIIAVMPAFFEEAVYRGIFYNTYRLRAGFGAALLSGLLFGAVHGNLNQFTYAFVLGVVFALIVEATDSLWSTVVCHMLLNSVSISTIYLMPRLLSWLEGVYQDAVKAGDSNTTALVESIIGGTDFSMDSVYGTETALTHEQVVHTILAYAIPAIVGALLAAALLYSIARRCGRLEELKGLFCRKQKEAPAYTDAAASAIEQDGATTQQAGYGAEESLVPTVAEPKTRIVTWTVVAGLIVQVLMMIATEAALRFSAVLFN